MEQQHKEKVMPVENTDKWVQDLYDFIKQIVIEAKNELSRDRLTTLRDAFYEFNKEIDDYLEADLIAEDILEEDYESDDDDSEDFEEGEDFDDYDLLTML